MTSHRVQMRVFHTLAIAAVSLAALVLGGYLFGLNVERPYLYYTNVPFPVIKNPVQAGDPVELLVGRCNRDQEPHGYLVTRQLRNTATGSYILLPDLWLDIQPGCTEGIGQINIVPPDTPPGSYVVSGRALVAGRFGNHQVEWQSTPFSVIKRRE